MASIKVVVVDQTGSKKTPVELPDDVQMKRLIPALVTKMSLPVTNASGEPISYKFDHIRTGKRLKDDDTLASIGAQADDRLKLIPEPTAGMNSLG